MTIIEPLDAFPVLHKRKSRPKAAFRITQQAA